MGSYSTKIEVAGITSLIESNEKELIELTEMHLPGFISRNASDFKIEFKFTEKNLSFERNVKDFHRKVEFLYAPHLEVDKKKKRFYLNKKTNTLPSRFYRGSIDTETKNCFFEVNSPKEFYKFFFAFCIKIAYILFCLKEKALMIHSSAIKKKRKCFLFVAPHEGGKTTIARLSHDSEVLSDDINILRKVNGITMVYGFPMGGKMPSFNPEGVPLENVFFIEKEKVNSFTKMSGIDSVVGLLKNDFSSLYFRSRKELIPETLTIAGKLLKGIGCYRMGFTLKGDFWKEINKGL